MIIIIINGMEIIVTFTKVSCDEYQISCKSYDMIDIFQHFIEFTHMYHWLGTHLSGKFMKETTKNSVKVNK